MGSVSWYSPAWLLWAVAIDHSPIATNAVSGLRPFGRGRRALSPDRRALSPDRREPVEGRALTSTSTTHRGRSQVPAEMFYDSDADLSLIQGRNVAVLGFGSQGHAHALSLRDSGVDVRVGLPEGSKSRQKAEAQGLRVLAPYEACEEADLIMVLTPDPAQRKVYA
ncbi:MAG TPA: NAD(P)-dependent oxidoreductase, partial [Propionibacteriaceae bacterium]|nr:NAD(P)-dependent oxidoreductase [Propionibacteriaceae bacterium]